jgi:8-oxo-dGTP diphosphatase
MSEEEKMLTEAVVVYLRRSYGFAEKDGEAVVLDREEVHFARKTRKIGKGCLLGYGGGVEPGQTPEEAALDELLQESSVVASPKHLRKIAVIYIHNTNRSGETVRCKLHVYELRHWGGTPRETDTHEMADPDWFPVDNLPFESMMLADPYWLPRALKGGLTEAVVHYGPWQMTLLKEPVVRVVESFD